MFLFLDLKTEAEVNKPDNHVLFLDLKTEAEVNGVSGQATTLTCTVSDTQSAPSQAYWKVDG